MQRSVVPQEDIASFLHHASCRPDESIVNSQVECEPFVMRPTRDLTKLRGGNGLLKPSDHQVMVRSPTVADMSWPLAAWARHGKEAGREGGLTRWAMTLSSKISGQFFRISWTVCHHSASVSTGRVRAVG